ncbi:hypothetical protein QF032_002441 [Streptomyces achromogenes]|nr:hypothetical protein [Streptomyces achromogenes]
MTSGRRSSSDRPSAPALTTSGPAGPDAARTSSGRKGPASGSSPNPSRSVWTGSDARRGIRSPNAPPVWQSEREANAAHILAWDAHPDERIAHEQIAICVPTNRMASELGSTLGEHGIRALEIGADGARGEPGIHIGTMFRFKGLEYQRMIIAGVSDGLVPREQVNQLRQADPARYRREEQRARSRRPGHGTVSTSSGTAIRGRSCNFFSPEETPRVAYSAIHGRGSCGAWGRELLAAIIFRGHSDCAEQQSPRPGLPGADGHRRLGECSKARRLGGTAPLC